MSTRTESNFRKAIILVIQNIPPTRQHPGGQPDGHIDGHTGGHTGGHKCPPYFAGAIILALLLSTSLFEAFRIEGSSMEPTLLDGERVLVVKIVYGLFLPFLETATLNWATPRRGDVIVIKSPQQRVDVIKRVIGIGGDLIEVKGNRLFLNGEVLQQQRVAKCKTGVGARQQHCMVYRSELGGQVFKTSAADISMAPQSVRVPTNHVYVLGDRRDFSIDSRSPGVGTMPVNQVKGKVINIYWSRGKNGLRWARMPKIVH